jgi:hypothetical protein
MSIKIKNTLVVITWDGVLMPLNHILTDTENKFDLLIYDYSGKADINNFENINSNHFLSIKSECKGDILLSVYQYITKNNLRTYDYIGVFDDDIYISYSDLNKLIFIASLENLDVFQASLSHDSYYNHRQFIHNPGYLIKETLWVEIMAPFYRMDIFLKAGPYLQHSISGTGIDVYLIPTIQKLLSLNKTYIVHGVQMKHCRPIRTDNRIFTNGKTNLEEIVIMNKISKEIVRENPTYFTNLFKEQILDRTYTYGIPLKYKIKRIPNMLKNLYKLLVDLSYR